MSESTVGIRGCQHGLLWARVWWWGRGGGPGELWRILMLSVSYWPRTASLTRAFVPLLQEPATVPVPCCPSDRTVSHLHRQEHASSARGHRRTVFSQATLQAEIQGWIELHFERLSWLWPIRSLSNDEIGDAYVPLCTIYSCTSRLSVTSAQEWHRGEKKGAWWHTPRGLCSRRPWGEETCRGPIWGGRDPRAGMS